MTRGGPGGCPGLPPPLPLLLRLLLPPLLLVTAESPNPAGEQSAPWARGAREAPRNLSAPVPRVRPS